MGEDESASLSKQDLVVSRDADVAPRVEQPFERTHVRVAHLLVVLERDLGRLDVDPLAEADARLQVRERSDIVGRSPQYRLQHDAEIVMTLLAQLAVEAKRVVRRGRILHVDAYEVPTR